MKNTRLALLPFSQLTLAMVMLCGLVCSGCRPEKPIEVKFEDKQPDLMLVGITLRGDAVWSIKLVNDRQKILDVEESIYAFAESIDFSESLSKPNWKVPADWKQKDVKRMSRIATFEIPDADEESDRTNVVVSKLFWDRKKMSAEDAIVDNINRWRGQMNVDEIVNFTIDDEGTPLKRSASSLVVPFMKEIEVSGTPMYFTTIQGTFQKTSGGPFMQAMAGGMTPEQAAKALANSKQESTTEQKKSEENKSAEERSERPIPIDFETPSGWKKSPGGSLTLLRFVIGEGPDQAQVSISRFPGSVTSVNWQSTVTMWQGQLKVKQTPEEKELASMTSNLPVGDLSAKTIEITGQKDKAGTALLGAMIQNTEAPDKDKWFVKMQGAEGIVKSQRANFESFVKSIQFKK